MGPRHAKSDTHRILAIGSRGIGGRICGENCIDLFDLEEDEEDDDDEG